MTAVSQSPTVFIVDDHKAVRRSLRWLVGSIGLRVETYASARELLDNYDSSRSGCLVVDVRMPDMSGPELQEELTTRAALSPIIFITGFGDVPTAVRALKNALALQRCCTRRYGYASSRSFWEHPNKRWR